MGAAGSGPVRAAPVPSGQKQNRARSPIDSAHGTETGAEGRRAARRRRILLRARSISKNSSTGISCFTLARNFSFCWALCKSLILSRTLPCTSRGSSPRFALQRPDDVQLVVVFEDAAQLVDGQLEHHAVQQFGSQTALGGPVAGAAQHGFVPRLRRVRGRLDHIATSRPRSSPGCPGRPARPSPPPCSRRPRCGRS